MNVPHDALFQKCINGSTPLNGRSDRAPDKKSFKRHFHSETPSQIRNKFKELFLIMNAPYKNCTNGFPLLNKRATRAPDKNYL